MTDGSRTETEDKKAEVDTPMLLNDSQVCPPEDLSTWKTMG